MVMRYGPGNSHRANGGSDWTDTELGFMVVDLVAHCGWTGAGPFLYTLTLGGRGQRLGQVRRAARQTR